MALFLDCERLTGLVAASQQVSFQTRPVEGTVGFGKVSTTNAAGKECSSRSGAQGPENGKGRAWKRLGRCLMEETEEVSDGRGWEWGARF